MSQHSVPPHGARIAVVGSGISGLAVAWLLKDSYQVSLIEAGSYFGGHSNTVDVTLNGMTHPVDTGFLVHNDLTYPNLIELFRHLKVDVHASDMSFGVSIAEPDIEWAGTDLSTVFAQRRNLIRPAFLSMLRDILRFNKNAQRYLTEAQSNSISLEQLLDRERFGQTMRDWYLLPMAAAIWSAPVKDILGFPAAHFLTFCLNHRLLQIQERPQWKTVVGGSRCYVQKLVEQLTDVRLNTPVQRVERLADSVLLHSSRGVERFDAVVLACHAPTSLALLDDAVPQEREVLQAFRYQENRAVLHTDIRLLPRRKKVWSAWNYLSQGGAGQEQPVAVSYLLNQLQALPFTQPVIVTLNPHIEPLPDLMLKELTYEHPILDAAAARAQEKLPSIQGLDRVWFCGAWAGYGFHEDGLKSALRVVRDFGVEIPWGAVYE
ncbi:MAG: FAD-dependent oxidoreductase [Burkholderiales bacterium]|nr:FAD-dependent oxidoreductase [Burkholderiales bacterium]